MAAGGECGSLMAGIDWSATPLGPVEFWPQSLISAVSILLASKAQIVMFWGADYLALYNDTYAPTIGDKHPQALGQPAAQNWSELWDMLEPLLSQVRSSGKAFAAEDYPFWIDRQGFIEDVYFDISYDPVRVEDGSVGGVFCIVSETTVRVLNERRLAMLSALDAQLIEATDIAGVIEAFRNAVGAAAGDLTFARLDLAPRSAHEPAATLDVGPVPPGLLPDAAGGIVDARDVVSGGEVVAVQLPLRTGGTTVGSVTLGVNTRFVLDSNYRQFLRFLAERIASAVRTAELYQAEHRIAATLQRAILPDVLVTQPGVGLSCRYLPATQGLDIGGDWYDAIRLDEDRLALIIGDVAGKGVPAAALMGQLRNALRAYLLDGYGPAQALDRLNRIFEHSDGAPVFATVLCAVLDTPQRLLTWASAGHLPPLVVVPGTGARYLDQRPGPPAGIARDPHTQQQVQLEDRDIVVLFTDGLVEDPEEHIDLGLHRAQDAASTADGPDEVLDRLLGSRQASRRRDDIAVLAAQLGH
jgi:hypothetical protein